MKISELKDEHRCYYCGQKADSIDHVIPRSVLLEISALDPSTIKNIISRRALEVPCCRECNTLLGASYQVSLAARKAELKKRLRKRYSKYLSLPEWTEGELKELGDGLRSKVEEGIKIQLLLGDRLLW